MDVVSLFTHPYLNVNHIIIEYDLDIIHTKMMIYVKVRMRK